MTWLVIGAENSGKSVLAEEIAIGTSDTRRIYLATMKVCDEAGRARVKKHREQRADKGFTTIERGYGLREMLEGLEAPAETTVLLECVSNLVGNELHENPKRFGAAYDSGSDRERFADEVAAEIRALAEGVHHLIIVTNAYALDAPGYDADTRLYVTLLHMVNTRLYAFSDHVVDLRKGQKD